MKRKPVIGIPSFQFKMDGTNTYGTGKDYIESVLRAGCLPMQLPVSDEENAAAYLDQVDGLLLPGGEDISPRLYGEAPLPSVTYLNFAKDQFEMSLLREAARRGMPVLGICRGLQLINVAFGGTLYQDIPSQLPEAHGHYQNSLLRDELYHRVTIKPDSTLAQVLRLSETAVNSFHHQCVRETASGFRVSAMADDGVVEGLEAVNKPILAVQFHPENLTLRFPVFLRLFEHLAEEAARWAKL
ncbi:MAG: gamma-glutamyl-gamma-aminobutyrate hydrolase family protein [Oscillospiraceae bacterium]|nr:gamma-glutamyl-gamma-aminobutyrate hydrolase family protein [Oscillospiraceae bacterium]